MNFYCNRNKKIAQPKAALFQYFSTETITLQSFFDNHQQKVVRQVLMDRP